jgi:ribosomal protein S12 methylthiotransferase
MEERTPDTITIGFVPLGCPKAIIDSETMLGRIAQAGFVVTGETEDVDVVIVNTCGFIESAKQEAMETIRTLTERKKTESVGRVIVTGCLPERMGKDLLSSQRL